MTDENAEISRAWNGVLFEKFLRFKPKQREPEVMAALKEALSVFVTPRGLYAPSSTWFIAATA